MGDFLRERAEEFTIKLADIPIHIKPLYQETKTFCRDYLTDERPDLSVEVLEEDIQQERKYSKAQREAEGLPEVNFSDRYIETLALYRKITAALLPYHVLLFHGAVIAVNGRAYIFTAKSGTGKTTHIRLWLKNIPNCHVLNGDKPLLLFRDGILYACGTPWMGKEGYGTNEILPVDGICLLKRAKENYIEPLSAGEAFTTLLVQTHIPDGNHTLPQVIKLLKNMENIRLYRLGCNMEPEAAHVSYCAMVKE